jgi:hypothetical protein
MVPLSCPFAHPNRTALLNAVESTIVRPDVPTANHPFFVKLLRTPLHKLLQVIARDCVQDAGEKFKESAMFYATARQRNAEKEMSEATLRKMHRKALCFTSCEENCLVVSLAPPLSVLQAEILESEVKAKLAKAFAQLRHAVHHYTEVKRDVEQGLLDRENKLAERHQGEKRSSMEIQGAASGGYK